MTEAEWLAAADPMPMLEFLKKKASERQLRLFGVACCYRMIEDMRVDRLCQQLIEVVERIADGGVTRKELEDVSADVDRCDGEHCEYWGNTCLWLAGSFWLAGFRGIDRVYRVHMAEKVANGAAQGLANLLLRNVSPTGRHASWERVRAAESRGQTDVIRDIFGNPFRLVTLNPSWLTSTVLALANGIYEEKAFDRMPILADALQDAGCDCEEILQHCRHPGEHCRGCWVVDLLLGRS